MNVAIAQALSFYSSTRPVDQPVDPTLDPIPGVRVTIGPFIRGNIRRELFV